MHTSHVATIQMVQLVQPHQLAVDVDLRTTDC